MPRILYWVGIPVILIVLVAVLWQWDWFIPIVEAKASAAIGRKVTIAHMHVHLGRVVEVTTDDVTVANPTDWAADDPPLAQVGSLTLQVNAWDYIRGRGLIIPLIALDKPQIYAAETAKGDSNFKLSTGSSAGSGASSSPGPQIGELRITDGNAHVKMPPLKADFTATIATRDQGDQPQIVVDAKGTYAAAPIVIRMIGGGLLSLRNAAQPWPIDLDVANGPTKVALRGTLDDPVALKGANVTLRFSGPDMGLLEHLVGFPIPKTPPYSIAGRLDFEGLQKIKFEDFHGTLGNSDIAGTIIEQPGGTATNGKPVPIVNMDLRSNRVDLADLNGFIGGTPGRTTTRNETAAERTEVAKARSSSKLLPDTPISIPRLTWADIHLRYHGAHIEGRDMPLDDLSVVMDIVDGRVTLHPVSFGIGKGHLLGNIDLAPESNKNVHAKIDIHLQNLDVARMMAATHAFHGAGSVSGVGGIDSTGNSLASLLANGNGGIKMAMAGGDLSALLVDISGLQFGNALLSALGVPSQTQVECFMTDLGLRRGILDFNAMVLDTKEGITNVGGNVDLRSEAIDLNLKTDSKHFSVGSLPTRINIGGTFKEPAIRPGREAMARAGAAVGLGVLFAPLAILPTVQFGTSEQQDARCGDLLRQARAEAGGKALPPPTRAD